MPYLGPAIARIAAVWGRTAWDINAVFSKKIRFYSGTRVPRQKITRRESGFRLGNGEQKAESRVARTGDVGQHPRRGLAPVPVQRGCWP
jgi:hypothetical protein